MLLFFGKILVAALVISFCSWLSNRKPDLAGFIIALPLTTLIALLFSYAEFRDSAKSVEFAKGIFVGVPLSLVFFVPFLLAQRLNLNFVVCYVSGLILLVLGYFLHRWVTSML